MIVLLCSLLIGCKAPQKVFKEDLRENNATKEYRTKEKKDSVFVLKTDSVWTEKQGDTVYVTKRQKEYVYINKIQKDTAIKQDTIYINKETVIEKDNKTIAKKAKNLTKDILVILAICVAVYIMIKRKKIWTAYRRLRKR